MKTDTTKIRWSRPFDPKKSLYDYLGDDVEYKKIIQEMDEKFLNHKWQYWVKEPVKDINFIGFYAHYQYFFEKIVTVTPETKSNLLTQYKPVFVIDNNLFDHFTIRLCYQSLTLLTNSGFDVRTEWKNFEDDLTVLWRKLPYFYTVLGKDSKSLAKLPVSYKNSNIFPQFSFPEFTSFETKVKKAISWQHLTKEIEPVKYIRKLSFPVGWQKNFDPKAPILKIVGDTVDYRKIIDSVDEKLSHKVWYHLRIENKYDVSCEQFYELIKDDIESIIWYTKHMIDHNFDPKIDWENEIQVQPVEDYLDYELEGPLGWSTNFYENNIYEPYYDLLTKLTEDRFDVRQQWKEFKLDMNSLWKALPDFYKGLGEESDHYIEKPEYYHPDNPFPQYPIPNDID